MSYDRLKLENIIQKIRVLSDEINPYLKMLNQDYIMDLTDEDREEFVRLSKLRSNYCDEVMDVLKDQFILDVWHNNKFDDWHLTDNDDGSSNDRTMCINHIGLSFPLLDKTSTILKSITIDANKNLATNSFRTKYKIVNSRFIIKNKPNFAQYFFNNSFENLNTFKSDTGFYLFLFDRDRFNYKDFIVESTKTILRLFEDNIKNGFTIDFTDAKTQSLKYKNNNPKSSEIKVFNDFLGNISSACEDLILFSKEGKFGSEFSFYDKDMNLEQFISLLEKSDLNYKLNHELTKKIIEKDLNKI